MQVEIERLESGQVVVNVQVESDRVKQEIDRVFRDYSRRVSIPGFRKGKAPRAVLERHLDPEALKQMTMDRLIPDVYEEAIKEADIEPLGKAQVESAEFQDDQSLNFKAVVWVKPQVTLGEYRNLKVTRPATTITPEQVEAELKSLQERRGEYLPVLDRGIEKGDLAVVDYQMSIDGNIRPEGGAQGYPLEVGADTFFSELNEGLMGARVQDVRRITVSYPSGHSDPELAGKEALFEVTVKEVKAKRLPQLNDDFARSVSDCQTLDELKERIKNNLQVIAQQLAEREMRENLVNRAVEGSFVDPPQVLVEQEVRRRKEEFEQALTARGSTWESYLEETGRDKEALSEEWEIEARAAVKRALILDAIGEKEKVEVAPEEMEAEIARLAESRKVTVAKVKKLLFEEDQLSRLVNRLYQRKVIQLLLDSAEVVAEEESPTSAEQDTDQSESGGQE